MTAKEEHKHVWEGKVARHAAARGGVSHFPGQLDSPALLRQEGDDYPIRPAATTPSPTAQTPLLIPP